MSALALPYLPGIGALGFVPLPPALLATIAALTLSYTLAAERTKAWFYRHVPGVA